MLVIRDYNITENKAKETTNALKKVKSKK